MSSTNQSPQYKKAQKKFLAARTKQEKLCYLEEMIKECPKHKSSEKMLANLKTRRKMLLKEIEKSKKLSKKKQPGIKKDEMQAVIIGFTNTGKSSLLKLLTNAEPEIADYNFTTKKPITGIIDYKKAKIQLIEIPAIESEYYDKGLVNTADTILIIINNIEQIKQIEQDLENTQNKKIIIFNKTPLIKKNIRKISETLKSQKYNFIILELNNIKNPDKEISELKTDELKQKIFESFDKIRVYTKEPKKETTEKPIILDKDSTVKDAAEKILHGFSKKIKETKIWGPSSKFPGQIIGLKHKLKDLDIIEFKTK